MKICASEIRAEIAYCEANTNEHDLAVTPAQRNLRKHYMRFVGRRKQLLAAFLERRPEAWRDYRSWFE